MIKEKDIIIRVSLEMKEELKRKANLLGISLSSYIRIILIKKIKDD